MSAEAPPTTIELSYDRAVELLREAVAEKGEDYLYPSVETGAACMYVEYSDGMKPQPSCIAANVLHRAGMSLAELGRYEGRSVDAVISRSAPQIEGDVRKLLRVAQREQDSGSTWGVAFARATRFTERVGTL